MELLFVILVLSSVCVPAQTAENCEPYTHLSGQCDTSHASSNFTVFQRQLQDAAVLEHEPAYVLNTTIGMYQYLHPCASVAQAALVLFYGYNASSELPPPNSAYWLMPHIAIVNTPFLGRRRRNVHYSSDHNLLHGELDGIRAHDGVQCVQHLIDMNKGVAFQEWRRQHPDFETPPPPTNTALPTSTTKQPTTHAGQLLLPSSCYVCEGLMCLLSPTSQVCPANKPLCYTQVTDAPGQGRLISRGCTSPLDCHVVSDICKNAEASQILGNTCKFCCTTTNCNENNIVIPTHGLYPPLP